MLKYLFYFLQAALEVGITSETKNLSPDVSEQELLRIIDELNNDDAVDGILVQLPIPEHISERRICNSIDCAKDVDGFNEKNVGRLCLDMNTLIPCTPLGVQELLKRSGIETFGKNAVVCGRSKNVGMPISMLLHADGRNDTNAMDATVTICHRFTPPEDLEKYCKLADIIVTATGVPGLIKGHMIKPGACLIDVGITRVKDENTGKTKLVGDIDFECKPIDDKCFHTNLIQLMPIIYCSCPRSSRSHNTSTRRCWTNDCHNAHEEHTNCRKKFSKRQTNEKWSLTKCTKRILRWTYSNVFSYILQRHMQLLKKSDLSYYNYCCWNL